MGRGRGLIIKDHARSSRVTPGALGAQKKGQLDTPSPTLRGLG